MDWVNNWLLWLESFQQVPIVRFAAFVVSPIIALISFYYALRDRNDLRKTTKTLQRNALRLGQAKERAAVERKRAEEKQVEVLAQQARVSQEQAEVQRLRGQLEAITKGAANLWSLKPAKPFPEYYNWMRLPNAAPIVTFGNLKGGVGKTTLAGNFAAYVSETLKMPVLIVDLDYQGSLSNMMMLAAEKEVEQSEIDGLLTPDADLAAFTKAWKHLEPKLQRGWIVPASFSLAERENQLLLQWMLDQGGAIDVRYRLAHILLNPTVRRQFGCVVIDSPPRMSLGTVNGIVVSQYFVVPTTLDTLGASAVPQFVRNMKTIKADLDLDIDLIGVVGMMSRQANISEKENRALKAAIDGAAAWQSDGDFQLPTIPRRQAIADAAGQDIACLGIEGSVFEPLFKKIAERIKLTNGK